MKFHKLVQIFCAIFLQTISCNTFENHEIMSWKANAKETGKHTLFEKTNSQNFETEDFVLFATKDSPVYGETYYQDQHDNKNNLSFKKYNIVTKIDTLEKKCTKALALNTSITLLCFKLLGKLLYFLLKIISWIFFLPCLIPRPIVIKKEYLCPPLTTTEIPTTEIPTTMSTTERSTTMTTITTSTTTSPTTTTLPPIIFTCPPCNCLSRNFESQEQIESSIKYEKSEIVSILNRQKCLERLICDGKVHGKRIFSETKRTKYKSKISNLLQEVLNKSSDKTKILDRIIFQDGESDTTKTFNSCTLHQCDKIEYVQLFLTQNDK